MVAGAKSSKPYNRRNEIICLIFPLVDFKCEVRIEIDLFDQELYRIFFKTE